jgi:hypothetical protein
VEPKPGYEVILGGFSALVAVDGGAQMDQSVAAATGAGMTLVARGKDEVQRFFGDWQVLEPGLVPVSALHPDELVENPQAAYYRAGTARKARG